MCLYVTLNVLNWSYLLHDAYCINWEQLDCATTRPLLWIKVLQGFYAVQLRAATASLLPLRQTFSMQLNFCNMKICLYLSQKCFYRGQLRIQPSYLHPSWQRNSVGTSSKSVFNPLLYLFKYKPIFSRILYRENYLITLTLCLSRFIQANNSRFAWC